MNKQSADSLLVSTFPKFTYPYLWFNITDQQLLDKSTAGIFCGDVIDSEYDIRVVSDMCVLNSHGNREGGTFVLFWKAEAWVIEIYGASPSSSCF